MFLYIIGAKVTTQPRLFSGLFTYQSEYFASGDVPANGVSFISTEAKMGGFFIVPMANRYIIKLLNLAILNCLYFRHDLMTWDVSVSSINGIVASSGVDGRVI
uniref:WD_REPEATS_REGION domain-containing protein n=1 Tax=Heterorhabditis bacteriophora TaxID=37862 RepID=A0A1I7WJP0_HETBA